jgi:ABC-2 type transport system permease protein
LSWLLAPTWGMSAIRASTEGRNALPDIALCIGLAVAYGLIGTIVAGWLVNSARRRATLALS